MIIFDLDGTLADCEHRRHFVDPEKNINYLQQEIGKYFHILTGEKWQPDWKSFYEACNEDKPIDATITMIRGLFGWDYYDKDNDVQIWSGRCESVRMKTELWLSLHGISYKNLKMRPEGDNTPDDVLKEIWLDELCEETKWGRKHPIEFVVDDRPKVVRMWRRRGIFVFDVNQSGKEF